MPRTSSTGISTRRWAKKLDRLGFSLSCARPSSPLPAFPFLSSSGASSPASLRSSCLVGAPKKSDEFTKEIGVIFKLKHSAPDDCTSIYPKSSENSEENQSIIGFGSVVKAVLDEKTNSEVRLGCTPNYSYNSSDGRTNFQAGRCLFEHTEKLLIEPCREKDEVHCYAGFSASLFYDSAVKEYIVTLGMPGSFVNRGNVYSAVIRDNKIIRGFYLTNVKNALNQGFFVGYSVVTFRGFIKSRNPDSIVTIATSPSWRSNKYRATLIIMDSKLKPKRYFMDKWSHVGSQFGYSIDSGDFNNDGITDIAVGSPFYSSWKNESAGQHDIGAVFVFFGKKYESKTNEMAENYDLSKEPIILLSDSDTSRKDKTEKSTKARAQPGGYFGISVSNLGDIDSDGFDDLAIGCPNCGLKSNGQVFIYLGKYLKSYMQPFQVIDMGQKKAKNGNYDCEDENYAARKFERFGWSLSGNYDNGLSMLSIGDYASSQVSFFKAKKLVWLDKPVWQIISPKKLIANGKRQKLVMKLKIRLRSNIKQNKKFRIQLKFVYKIDTLLDDYNRRLKIDDASNLKTFSHIFRNNVDTADINFIFKSRPQNLLIFSWKPLYINVTFEKAATINQDNWMFHPYASQLTAQTMRIPIQDLTCPNERFGCKSDLQVSMIDITEGLTRPDHVYYGQLKRTREQKIIIHNNYQTAYAIQLNIQIGNDLAKLKSINVRRGKHSNAIQPINCRVLNKKYPKYFGNPDVPIERECNLDYSIRIKAGKSVEVYTSLILSDVFPLKKSDRKSFLMTVSAKSGNPTIKPFGKHRTANLIYSLLANSTVEIVSREFDRVIRDKRKYTRSMIAGEQIFASVLGPEFVNTFLITNEGPATPVGPLYVEIDIPYSIKSNNDPILYFINKIMNYVEKNKKVSQSHLPSVIDLKNGTTVGQCTVPQEFVNPQNLRFIRAELASTNKIISNEMKLQRKRRSLSNEDSDWSSQISSSSPNPNEPFKTATIMSGSDSGAETEANRAGLGRAGIGRSTEWLHLTCDPWLKRNRNRKYLEVNCARIKCRVDTLHQLNNVQIQLKVHLLAHTFFKHKLPNVIIHTRINSNLAIKQFKPNLNLSTYEFADSFRTVKTEQQVMFTGIKIKKPVRYEIWQILVGVFVGLIVLILMVVILWKCGFFKRKRKLLSKKQNHKHSNNPNSTLQHRTNNNNGNINEADQNTVYSNSRDASIRTGHNVPLFPKNYRYPQS